MSSAEPEVTLLIDLARSEDERVEMAGLRAAFPGAVVLAAYDLPAPGSININSCLSSEEFVQEQALLARQLDHHLDENIVANPRCRELIDGMRGQIFEHNLHELHKWIYTLARFLEGRDPSSIRILLPKRRTSSGMALFEAEGEVSTNRMARLLYRRTDYLLHYLDRFLEVGGFHRRERFALPRRDWVGPVGRRLLRTYGILGLRAATHLKNWLRHRPSAAVEPPGEAQVLALSRSVVHSDYLASLVHMNVAAPVVVDSPFHYPRTYKATCELFDGNVSHLYEHISFGVQIRQFVRSLWDLARHDLGIGGRPNVTAFPFFGMKVCLSTCVREAISARFEHEMVASGVRRYLGKYEAIKTFVHCEMFTSYAPYFAKVCRDLGVKSYQMAFGTYEMRPVARSVFGDGFLCFSKGQEDSFRSVHENDERLIYRGNLYIDSSLNSGDEAAEIERRLASRSILYFSQPYAEAEEDEVVEWLASYCDSNGYYLTAVLHPRGRMSGPISLQSPHRVVDNSEYLAAREDFEREAAIAVTRTSNIGYQLLLRKVPLINVLAFPHDQLVRQEYFDGYPLLCGSKGELHGTLADIHGSIQGFYEFRSRFIYESYRNLGAVELSRFLTEVSK